LPVSSGLTGRDRGSFEEGRFGWRRGMKDTVVQLEGVDGEDGKDEED
jgi:hypothetical protein